MDFPHCYRILGLPPECDWEQARHRYQQLVSRLHPDRPAASGQKQSLTEINLAWRQLRKYYQQHGHLPLQTNGVNSAARPVTPFEPALAAVGNHHWRRWLAVMAIPIALLLLWPDRTTPPRPAESWVAPPPVTTEAESPAITAVSTVRHGDPLGHVVETLGPPHDIRGSRWYYGDSWIELRDGRVSDWHSSVDHPLPTDTLSHHQR